MKLLRGLRAPAQMFFWWSGLALKQLDLGSGLHQPTSSLQEFNTRLESTSHLRAFAPFKIGDYLEEGSKEVAIHPPLSESAAYPAGVDGVPPLLLIVICSSGAWHVVCSHRVLASSPLGLRSRHCAGSTIMRRDTPGPRFDRRSAALGGNSLLASHLDEPGLIPGGVAPEFSHAVIVPDDAAGRRVFSGSSFPPALAFQRCSILSTPCITVPVIKIHTELVQGPALSSGSDFPTVKRCGRRLKFRAARREHCTPVESRAGLRVAAMAHLMRGVMSSLLASALLGLGHQKKLQLRPEHVLSPLHTSEMPHRLYVTVDLTTTGGLSGLRRDVQGVLTSGLCVLCGLVRGNFLSPQRDTIAATRDGAVVTHLTRIREDREFDSRSGHPDFGFPRFPETTPGECWDGSVLHRGHGRFLPQSLFPVQRASSLMTSLSTRR
ncbi:hypothetical protein PR048_028202 [Dryococelus australis]|uniref:Uncharacterized protein n=1 Tax=Dryococelus australis TaxID=614101 RepID=A0ABQ9GIK5_9NEOP|nr:hypothetical protein PR048_028202 [Dryococelus australis]